jgi:toxin ParE1/3/4
LKIVWTDEAVGNLDTIASYISAFNPAAAERMAARLIELADSLGEFPNRGRDAGDGRREMTIVWPYILRYRVQGDVIVILRIRHGAQDEDDTEV